jgi:lipoprotein signal peptidase
MKNTATYLVFLKPLPFKMLFLAEWLIFILILFAQGEIRSLQQLAIATYPLLLFYLGACILFALRDRKQPHLSSWGPVGLAVCLAIIDQGCKTSVVAFLSQSASIPIIPEWLEITHQTNQHGAWIFNDFADSSIPFITTLLKVLFFAILATVIPLYRYFKAARRNSLWLEASFILIFAGLISWTIDMFGRGFIVDYIGLPHLIAADLKDIYIYFGAAALVLEILDYPGAVFRWSGWPAEQQELGKVARGVSNILLRDFQFLQKVVSRKRS